jgi:hypothetical protein
LLDPASAIAWQITPVRSATSTDGTTWVQTFRLSPFVPGDDLPVKFNPIRVNGTAVAPESFTLKVETALRNPTAADARPVTGIEQLPSSQTSEPPLILAGITLLVSLVAVLVAVMVAARKRRAKPLSPGERIRGRIGGLRSNLRSGLLTEAEFVGCLAAAFREYLTHRFGLNTEQMTTAELIASADGVWDADARTGVEDLLTACDAVKFAGKVPSPTDCEALADQAGRLVDGWEVKALNGTR